MVAYSEYYDFFQMKVPEDSLKTLEEASSNADSGFLSGKGNLDTATPIN